MRKLTLAMAMLFCAMPLRAQTIAQQLVNQTAVVGQSAVFTVTVNGGPCRSVWYINGAKSYGAYASTISYIFPSVTLAQNGTTVKVELYGCAGGTADFFSNQVTLTVTSTPPKTITVSFQALYDDGSLTPLQLVIDQIVTKPDGTLASSPVLQLLPNDPLHPVTGQVLVYPTVQYRMSLFMAGVPLAAQVWDGSLILTLMPNISGASFTLALVKATGQVKSFSSLAN